MELLELSLDKEHEWIGKRISDVSLEAGKLIVMVQRDEDVVIPNGGTLLKKGDILVIKENCT